MIPLPEASINWEKGDSQAHKLAVESEAHCVIPTFGSEIIWRIGTAARQLALDNFPGKSIKIDIISLSEEELFHTVVGEKTNPDNDNWVRRKRNTVLKFNCSSYVLKCKLFEKQKGLKESKFYDDMDYATHGGAVPIFVPHSHGIVGVLTVSGLKDHEDHFLAIEALKLAVA